MTSKAGPFNSPAPGKGMTPPDGQCCATGGNGRMRKSYARVGDKVGHTAMDSGLSHVVDDRLGRLRDNSNPGANYDTDPGVNSNSDVSANRDAEPGTNVNFTTNRDAHT